MLAQFHQSNNLPVKVKGKQKTIKGYSVLVLFTRFCFWSALGILCAIFFQLLKQQVSDPTLFWLFFVIFVFTMLTFGVLGLWAISLYRHGGYNERYKDVVHYFERLDKAFYIVNPYEEVVFANKGYKALWGAQTIGTIFELLGREKTFAQGLYQLKVKANRGERAAQAFAVDRFHNNLKSLFTDDTTDTTRWISISAVPSVDNPEETIWQIEDITAVRAAYQEHFQKVLSFVKELNHGPAAIFVTNEAEELTFYNEYLAKILALESAETSSEPLSLANIFTEASLKQIQAIFDSHKEKEVHYVRAVFASKRGDFVACDLYFRQNLSKHQKAGGYHFLAIVTEEEDFSFSEDDATKVGICQFIDSLPVAAALVDAHGHPKYMNISFADLLEGDQVFYNSNEAIHLDDLVKNESGLSLAEMISKKDRLLEGKRSFEAVLKKNPEKHLYFAFSPLKASKGTILKDNFLCIAKESTEQKAFEKQLDQNQKMQAVGQLAGGIAHDFNNVLTAIIMSCDLLLTSHRSSDPSHPDLINIKNNANRAAALVQQLLAFSRRQTLRPEMVDLVELFSDLRLMLTRLIGPHIALTIRHGQNLQKVFIDQASMQRVIINLILNARDAMPQGGKIDIFIENISLKQSKALESLHLAPAKYVKLTISDSGSGIPEEIKDKIFEPFFTTKELGKGTGLGLSMVYGIIKQMHGAITCDNLAEGGASFQIFLPVSSAANLEGEKNSFHHKSGVAEAVDLTGNATILIVEDEDAVRRGNVRALQSRGYKVLEACSGVEAVEIINEHGQEIDLVVSDVVMPEMDGPTLLCEVQKAFPDLPFIFVSGYAEEAFSKNLPKDAQFRFLAKPFSLKTLASKVKEVLAEKHERDKLKE